MNKNSTANSPSTVFSKFKEILVNTFSAPDFENFKQTTGHPALDDILFAVDRTYEEKINALARFIQQSFQARQCAIYLVTNYHDQSIDLALKAYYNQEEATFDEQLAVSEKLIKHTYLKKQNIKQGYIPPDYSSTINFEGDSYYLFTSPLVIFGKVIGLLELTSSKKLNQEQINELKSIALGASEYLINLKNS